MSIKYKPLRDRRPKNEPIVVDVDGVGELKFKSPMDYKDGELFDVFRRVQTLDQNIGGMSDLIDDMAKDPEALKKTFAESDVLLDADKVGIFQSVTKEFMEQMGTLGESTA